MKDSLPIYITPTTDTINFARLFTYGAGTSESPSYTVFIYRSAPAEAPQNVTARMALMESTSTSFGASIQFELDDSYAMVYQVKNKFKKN